MTETAIGLIFDVADGISELIRKLCLYVKTRIYNPSYVKAHIEKGVVNVVNTRRIKIYAITFMKYTNGAKTTVRNDITNEYLDVNEGPILIREDEIPYYINFGKGIDIMRFVGYLGNKTDSNR
jgi:hypothetical protein